MGYPHFPTVVSIAKRDILRTDPSTSVRAAADLMRDFNLTSVIFLVGGLPYIFTVEHILNIVHGGNDLERPLSTLGIPPATTVREEQTVLDAMEQMEISGSRYLAVADGVGSITGIVTYTDILDTIDPALLVEKRTIGELVRRKELVTFSPDWILEDVLCHLIHIEDSIIVVESSKPVGIITSKDAFRIVLSNRGLDGTLSEYMTTPVITVPCSASVYESLVVLTTKRIKRAVVLDELDQLLGVVTQSELVGFAYGYWSRLLRDHSGEIRELVAMLTAKAAQHRNDLLVDNLTGFGDRRHLAHRMRDEMERIKRYGGKSFSFLLIDIDSFKDINDRVGYAFGDEVIKSVANAISETLRGGDGSFRWGGDEFAVLLPHTSIAGAASLAARIKSRTAQMCFGAGVKVAVSIAVGEYMLTESEDSFFERIRGALCLAKQAGGNQVEISVDQPGRQSGNIL